MKCNYYTRNYQRYYTCRGSGLTEQNGFHGQKLLGLLAAILDAIQFLGLATAIAIMTLAYIENIHFLFFFFFFKYELCIYIYIFLVHLFLSSRAERNCLVGKESKFQFGFQKIVA